MRRDFPDVIAAPSAGPADGQFDLAALGHALWRRKRWIIIPTALAAGAAAIFVTLTTPIFRSEALVLIENRETAYNRPELGDRQGERERPLVDAEAVQSQVQLAYSRDLAREVVRDLKLAERREFNPDAGGSPLTAMMSAYLPGLMEPMSPGLPIRSAAPMVADWMACMGVMPYFTIHTNCFAFHPWG